MGQAIAQLLDLSNSVTHPRQGRTELAERVGFECVSIALISHDYKAFRQVVCRHYFRHGNSAAIERVTQDGVLRGLRGGLPRRHTHMNFIPPHA